MADVIPTRRSNRELPTGTVTFVLTDVEGSVRGWEADQAAMARAVALHHQIIDGTVERHSGARPQEQGEGDSIVAAFERASDAIACALDTQLAMAKEDWESSPISVRIGIHTGEAHLRDESNYYGQTINRCARLRAIAHGGQIILSQSTYDLVLDHVPESATLKDLGAHRLRDLARPEHVYQLCHPDLPVEFPPLRSLDTFPNNLPVQLKSFVSRDREISEVESRLSAHRLLTLTGAGGAGKTRLALHVAADQLENFPDGTWLVDLYPVTDPSMVVRSVMSALGLQEGAAQVRALPDDETQISRSSSERLLDYLKDRQLLLVFDNCEHLIPACATLTATILASCPRVTILVTSREPLGVEGEATWRVPSLSLPDESGVVDPEAYQAVRLFVDRACLSKSDFRLTPDNSRAVWEICRRLNGMPLSIELAAARVRVLTPQQISSMLDDQFRLLTGGSRTALERQQTLRASVDWSYSLLSEPERVLLRRFSVFGGGATLEAVEKVCAGEAVASHDVLDLLSSLVDKSMIEAVEHGGHTRYRVLETIRQYSREKLVESAEAPNLRTLHRDFFLDLAERARPDLEWGDEIFWLDLLEEEQDNLGVAMAWTIDGREAEIAVRFVHALRDFWILRGGVPAGRRWANRAVELMGEASDEIRARSLLDAGKLALEEWDVQAAREFLEEAMKASSEPSGEETLIMRADALGMKAQLAAMRAAHLEAKSLAEDSIHLSTQVGFPRGVWFATLLLAYVTAVGENYDAGIRLFHDTLAMARASGSKSALSTTLGSWAFLARNQKDIDAAGEYARDALEWARSLKDKRGTAFWLNMLAYVTMNRGEFAVARESLEEAISISREQGDNRAVAGYRHSLGELMEAEGESEAARTLFLESLTTSRESSYSSLIAECEWGLARLARAEGSHDESVSRNREALLELARAEIIPAALRRLGEALVGAGRYEAAGRILGSWEGMIDARIGRKWTIEDLNVRERAGFEADLATLREGLGAERLEAVWGEGREVSPENAVEYALRISNTS